jgi:hypothetical protein
MKLLPFASWSILKKISLSENIPVEYVHFDRNYVDFSLLMNICLDNDECARRIYFLL